MRVNAILLEGRLWADERAANTELDRVSLQEGAIDDALRDFSMGTSVSLDAFRRYLAELRLPATMALREYLGSYITDMHTDQARIASDLLAIGPVVDTERVQSIINKRFRSASDLDALAQASWVDYGVASLLHGLASGLRSEARFLQGLLERAYRYMYDNTIYASTMEKTGIVRQSQRALQAVVVGSSGQYDFSSADLSWVSSLDWSKAQQDEDARKRYWKERNRQALERYFYIDGKGNVVGVRPEMLPRYGELTGIALKCVFDTSTGMPQEIDGLSDDEKYVVLYFLSTVGPKVHALEYGAMGLANDIAGMNILKPAISALDLAESGPLSVLISPLLTKGLSFTTDGTMFYSINSPVSVQARNGFSDVTELGGAMLGMDLETHVTTFEYEGYEYRLQAWDGTYGSGAAYGGEVGLYRRKINGLPSESYQHMGITDIRNNLETLDRNQVKSIFTTYETVSGSDLPDMQVVVHADDAQERMYSKGIRNSTDDTYWSFNATDIPCDQDGNYVRGFTKEYTNVEVRLNFEDNPGLAKALEAALENSDGVSIVHDVGDSGSEVHIVWDKVME